MCAFYRLGQKGRTRTWGLRELVRRHPKRALLHFHRWVHDPNEGVRARLCAGTCTRAMPGGRWLKGIIEQPEVVLELLENLKNDPVFRIRKAGEILGPKAPAANRTPGTTL